MILGYLLCYLCWDFCVGFGCACEFCWGVGMWLSVCRLFDFLMCFNVADLWVGCFMGLMCAFRFVYLLFSGFVWIIVGCFWVVLACLGLLKWLLICLLDRMRVVVLMLFVYCCLVFGFTALGVFVYFVYFVFDLIKFCYSDLGFVVGLSLGFDCFDWLFMSLMV